MAIAEAQAILSQIEVMYYLFGGNGVSIKFVKNLAEMLNKEIVLIKGVLKNDQSKYERVIGK